MKLQLPDINFTQHLLQSGVVNMEDLEIARKQSVSSGKSIQDVLLEFGFVSSKRFAETLAELCPPVAARHFMERALRIAQSFEVGIAAHNGVILSKGERYDPVSSWQPK